MENDRKGDWMQVHSGAKYYPYDPRAEDFDIMDIAHALSNTCRFNGHCKTFYSVAQHSVIVSQKVNEENAMWGLLHDAAEAYLGDMVAPIKRGIVGDDFRTLEDLTLRAMAEGHELVWPIPTEVKVHDIRALATEKRDLMVGPTLDWGFEEGIIAYEETIVPLPPVEAHLQFLTRYEECLKIEARKSLEEADGLRKRVLLLEAIGEAVREELGNSEENNTKRVQFIKELLDSDYVLKDATGVQWWVTSVEYKGEYNNEVAYVTMEKGITNYGWSAPERETKVEYLEDVKANYKLVKR